MPGCDVLGSALLWDLYRKESELGGPRLMRRLRMSHARRGRYGRGRLARLVAAVAILAIPAGVGLQSAGAAVFGPQARVATTPASHTTCRTAGGATTCTGTYGGDRA